MDKNIKHYEDEEIVFADETEETHNENTWKVLIVDDEREVHRVTELALGDFEFEGKRIDFFSAYSCEEALEVVKKETNIAAILLDVVMEEKDSGLKFARILRNDLNNKLTRIILRTGQPGDVLNEEKVTFEYDINDYKTKTELTSKKLTITMLVALRSYRDLMLIEESKIELNKHKEHLEELVEERTNSLKAAQEQLIISEKMSSIGKFVSGIAHEINSPLVGVLTNVELLEMDLGDLGPDNIGETKNSILDHTAMIKNAAKKSRDIISNLLRYTKKETRNNATISIGNVIQETEFAFHETMERFGIRLLINVKTDWVIKGNEIDLVRALINILDNSVYSLTKKESSPKKIEVTTFTQKTIRYLTIKDNGTGIDNEIRTKVFDPFFTTKPVGDGMGLGLTVAYEIIKKHGGTISIESKVNEFTKLVIAFDEQGAV